MDVTSEESAEKATEKIVEECGRFDGMIANAGMTRYQPALEFTMGQVRQLFELNDVWSLELCDCCGEDAY